MINMKKEMQYIDKAQTFILRKGDFWEVVPIDENFQPEGKLIKLSIQELLDFLEDRMIEIEIKVKNKKEPRKSND